MVGLFMQQAIALFVLKSGAGLSIFQWIATAASDFLAQGLAGAGFFFSADVVAEHWFFVNTVSPPRALSWSPHRSDTATPRTSSPPLFSSSLSCRCCITFVLQLPAGAGSTHLFV
jgi:hypothetical protein